MDLFYYGSQDVPLPLGRGASRPRSRLHGEAAVYCESCSAPVPEGDLQGGRAAELFGLILCETCRMKASAEERIELYFCDRCQVSVPVYRVDTGEALAGDGRILCVACRERRTPAARFMRIGALAALLLALLTLGLLLGAEPRDSGGPAPAAVVPMVRAVLRSELADLGLAGRSAVVFEGLQDLDERVRMTRESKNLAVAHFADMQVEFTRLLADISGRLDLLEAEAARFDGDVDALLAGTGPLR